MKQRYPDGHDTNGDHFDSHFLPGQSVMKQELSIGDRVQISALGAARCPRLAGKSGIVVGRSVYPNSLNIRLDGNGTSSTFHRDYVEIAAADRACPVGEIARSDHGADRQGRAPTGGVRSAERHKNEPAIEPRDRSISNAG